MTGIHNKIKVGISSRHYHKVMLESKVGKYNKTNAKATRTIFIGRS